MHQSCGENTRLIKRRSSSKKNDTVLVIFGFSFNSCRMCKFTSFKKGMKKHITFYHFVDSKRKIIVPMMSILCLGTSAGGNEIKYLKRLS